MFTNIGEINAEFRDESAKNHDFKPKSSTGEESSGLGNLNPNEFFKHLDIPRAGSQTSSTDFGNLNESRNIETWISEDETLHKLEEHSQIVLVCEAVKRVFDVVSEYSAVVTDKIMIGYDSTDDEACVIM